MMTDAEWEQVQLVANGGVRPNLAARTRMRRALARLQGYICPICGASLHGRPPEGRQGNLAKTTLDHVIPRDREGPDRPGNYLAAHGLCNFRKGNRMPTGCELIWLLAMNNRLGIEPTRW